MQRKRAVDGMPVLMIDGVEYFPLPELRLLNGVTLQQRWAASGREFVWIDVPVEYDEGEYGVTPAERGLKSYVYGPPDWARIF